jgi:hypothetical protein
MPARYACHNEGESVKRKFGTAAIVMLMLLGLRIFGQIESLMTSLSVGALVMFCIYLAAIIGIYGRKPWGDVLCAVVGVTDIATTLMYTGGASRVGAVVVDSLMIYLAFEDYKTVKASKKPEDVNTAEKSFGNGQSP